MFINNVINSQRATQNIKKDIASFRKVNDAGKREKEYISRKVVFDSVGI